MTRYRFKTARRIEKLIRDNGPMTVNEVAHFLEMEPRVVRNYLRTHRGVFEKKFFKAYKSTIWGLKSD